MKLLATNGKFRTAPGGRRLLTTAGCACCGGGGTECDRYVRYARCPDPGDSCPTPGEFYTCSEVCGPTVYFAGRCYNRQDVDGCFYIGPPIDGCNPLPFDAFIVDPGQISCEPDDCNDPMCEELIWFKAVPCRTEVGANPPCLWIPCENMPAFMDGRACAVFQYLGVCYTVSWSSEIHAGASPPPPCATWGDVPSFFYERCCACVGGSGCKGNECGTHPSGANVWVASQTDDVVVIPEGSPDCCTHESDFVTISMTRDHIIYRPNGTRDIRNQTWSGSYGRFVSTAQFYQRREVEQTGDVTITEAPIDPICGTPGSGLWEPHAEDIDGNEFRLWDRAAGITNSFVSGSWSWSCNRLTGSLRWERYTSGGELSETIEISGTIAVTRTVSDCYADCGGGGVFGVGQTQGRSSGGFGGVWGLL